MTKVIYNSEVYELVSYVPREKTDDSIGNMKAIIKKDGVKIKVDSKLTRRSE